MTEKGNIIFKQVIAGLVRRVIVAILGGLAVHHVTVSNGTSSLLTDPIVLSTVAGFLLVNAQGWISAHLHNSKMWGWFVTGITADPSSTIEAVQERYQELKVNKVSIDELNKPEKG